MDPRLNYPFDSALILRKKAALKRELSAGQGLIEKRIAILGGSTSSELVNILELFLLNGGIRPVFYESEYNKYYEDVLFDNPSLVDFKPELIYVYTGTHNIQRFPALSDSEAEIDAALDAEFRRWESVWAKIEARYGCPTIQNNFELPSLRPLGNLDSTEIHGKCHFVSRLNQKFAAAARERAGLQVFDLHYLSARYGLERWQDRQLWFMAKYALSYDAIPTLAAALAALILAHYGKSRKCLVLDLDNTLWGGVIGDDGPQGIQIGRETALAEAFTDFHQYALELKDRGVVLAVASKNDEQNALLGLQHPDSLLKPADFAALRANWDPKCENLQDIAKTIELGLDSLVFVDDNPMEREAVKATLPDIAVPQVGDNPAVFAEILDRGHYFEPLSLSAEDLKRSNYYAANANRRQAQGEFSNFDDFLKSLEMSAEIKPFSELYLDRITQLTNKTNQFNLTTRRVTLPEMQAAKGDPQALTLYGRLADRLGDNGLVAVILGRVREKELHLELWLMSCRVLKRGMEAAMLDALVAACQERGIAAIWGYYAKTPKNNMVSQLYGELGFERISLSDNGDSVWRLDLAKGYEKRNHFIKVAP